MKKQELLHIARWLKINLDYHHEQISKDYLEIEHHAHERDMFQKTLNVINDLRAKESEC